MALVTPIVSPDNDGVFVATFPGGSLELVRANHGDLESGNGNHWLSEVIDRSVLESGADYDYDFSIDCRVSYSYVDPDVFTDGEYSDHGFLVNGGVGNYAQTDYDLRLPSVLAVYLDEYSIPLNGADKIGRDALKVTFNESEIRTLCECRYVTNTRGEGLGYEEVIKFLLAEDTGHDWIIFQGDSGEAEVNLHRHI